MKAIANTEDKSLTDCIKFVYDMLSMDEADIAKEPVEMQEFIRELRRDEKLIDKVDDVCFELLTAIQQESVRRNGHSLTGLGYSGVVELVGKLCVFLILNEIKDNKSQQAEAGSVEDGEVSEPVDSILSYESYGGKVLTGVLELVRGYTTEIKPDALPLAISKGIADFGAKFPGVDYSIRINPWTKNLLPAGSDVSLLVEDKHVPYGYIWMCKEDEQ